MTSLVFLVKLVLFTWLVTAAVITSIFSAILPDSGSQLMSANISTILVNISRSQNQKSGGSTACNQLQNPFD